MNKAFEVKCSMRFIAAQTPNFIALACAYLAYHSTFLLPPSYKQTAFFNNSHDI